MNWNIPRFEEYAKIFEGEQLTFIQNIISERNKKRDPKMWIKLLAKELHLIEDEETYKKLTEIIGKNQSPYQTLEKIEMAILKGQLKKVKVNENCDFKLDQFLIDLDEEQAKKVAKDFGYHSGYGSPFDFIRNSSIDLSDIKKYRKRFKLGESKITESTKPSTFLMKAITNVLENPGNKTILGTLTKALGLNPQNDAHLFDVKRIVYSSNDLTKVAQELMKLDESISVLLNEAEKVSRKFKVIKKDINENRTEYFVDGILVLTWFKVYNNRYEVYTRELRWNREGLNALFGEEITVGYSYGNMFRDEGHDLGKYGDGSKYRGPTKPGISWVIEMLNWQQLKIDKRDAGIAWNKKAEDNINKRMSDLLYVGESKITEGLKRSEELNLKLAISTAIILKYTNPHLVGTDEWYDKLAKIAQLTKVDLHKIEDFFNTQNLQNRKDVEAANTIIFNEIKTLTESKVADALIDAVEKVYYHPGNGTYLKKLTQLVGLETTNQNQFLVKSIVSRHEDPSDAMEELMNLNKNENMKMKHIPTFNSFLEESSLWKSKDVESLREKELISQDDPMNSSGHYAPIKKFVIKHLGDGKLYYFWNSESTHHKVKDQKSVASYNWLDSFTKSNAVDIIDDEIVSPKNNKDVVVNMTAYKTRNGQKIVRLEWSDKANTNWKAEYLITDSLEINEKELFGIESKLNEDYGTSFIQPGYVMECGGKTVVVVEITDFQNMTAWRIIVRDVNSGIFYEARFNGHMYIIACEIPQVEEHDDIEIVAQPIPTAPNPSRFFTRGDLDRFIIQ